MNPLPAMSRYNLTIKKSQTFLEFGSEAVLTESAPSDMHSAGKKHYEVYLMTSLEYAHLFNINLLKYFDSLRISYSAKLLQLLNYTFCPKFTCS